MRSKRLLAVILCAALLLASCAHFDPEKKTFRRGQDRTSDSPNEGDAEETSGRVYLYEIADVEWASENYPNFLITTPEEFAGVVRYVNEAIDDSTSEMMYIELKNDLDLDAYEWAPIMYFQGMFNGAGHTIRNIHLNNPIDGHNGIIGVNGGAIGVCDLRVENAEVNGGDFVGVIIAQGYMLNVQNIYASGVVNSDGEFVGALIGRTSPMTTYDGCSMDIMLNGAPAMYLSYTEENESHADEYAKEIYTLTLDDDHTVNRTDEDYKAANLCWRVIYNDEIVLERGADDELSYKYFRDDPGKYTIYLVEFNQEFYGYVRVSNVVEFVIP